ncbi:MAG: hypothetical protein RLP09_15670 [Sandaracinaceae bacterium]
MSEKKGRLRVELETPSGTHHVAEQSLSTSLIGLYAESRESRGGSSSKLGLLDAIMEQGSALLLRVAGAISRSDDD